VPGDKPPDPSSEAATVANLGGPTQPSPNDGPTAPAGANTPALSRPSVSRSGPAFRAGDLIAGRFRIVAPIGKGGMGEVFRADDLELAAPVALKFLPQHLSADPLRLDHFRSEVRLARQISHPGVCRVYDIAQVDTPAGPRHFLSMEFIDGEDLSSLLRRIGRLPHDKAVQIARQICFGLAAAHEHNVIHRDLKPANIMLDGRGNARITDFGVAGLADDLNARGDIAAGTPEYMAPEQLEGREITRRSDIYALGLVLFEIFTGKPAFKASTFAELREQRSRGTPASRPSSIVPDLDPAVERVILRCLEADPGQRPASAIAVAAALPGGDPLAAAIAAGETPSPELIAASGGSAVITPRAAFIAVACLLASIATFVFATRPSSLLAQARPAKSVEVLTDRAQEILRRLELDLPHQTTAARLGQRPRGWFSRDQIHSFPGRFGFWYRQSPAPFSPAGTSMKVLDTDPFPSMIGEAIVRTDDRGTLEGLMVIPPSRIDPPPTPRDPDQIYRTLFELAGLDLATFTPTPPTRRPPFTTDHSAAWSGPDPLRPGESLVVHAAVTDSRPTYFHIRYPFTVDPRGWGDPSAPNPTPSSRLSDVGVTALVIAITISMSLLAWRNLSQGRGDRRAANIGAVAVLILAALNLALAADVQPSIAGLFFEGRGYSTALWIGGLFWLFYTALEPAARRNYPHALISWSRLIRGQLTDPLLARDILFGLVAGTSVRAAFSLIRAAAQSASPSSDPPRLLLQTSEYFGGFSGVAAACAGFGITAVMNATGSLLLMVVGRLLFRSKIGGIAFCIAGLATFQAGTLASEPLVGALELAMVLCLVILIATRGLLVGVVFGYSLYTSGLLAVGPDWSGFCAPAWIPAALLAAIAAWSIRCGLRGTSASLAPTP
jgi:hypothetical protein